MQKSILIALLTFASLVGAGSAIGQSQSPQKESIEGSEVEQANILSPEVFKEQWGLTDVEYEKFQEVLKGPFGFYTPNLEKNPILALGLAAESTEERNKYASKYVDVEFAKNVKVVAFQLAVSSKWQEKFPQTPRFANQSEDKHKRAGFLAGQSNDARAKIFIEIGCTKCDQEFERLYEKSRRVGGGVDVYFTGRPSTEAITKWALSQDLDPMEVKQKIVTLNRSNEKFDSLPVIRR